MMIERLGTGEDRDSFSVIAPAANGYIAQVSRFVEKFLWKFSSGCTAAIVWPGELPQKLLTKP